MSVHRKLRWVVIQDKEIALGMQNVCTQKIALDTAEIPTWVAMSPSPAAAASSHPLEA